MGMATPHSHCHHCGTAFRSELQGNPEKLCSRCKMYTYLNPTPVSVILVPTFVHTGIVGLYSVRRGIEPKKGMMALPGGFILEGETWKVAGAREVWEELQIEISNPEENIEAFGVESNPEGTRVLVFGVVRSGRALTVHDFKVSEEALERGIFTRILRREEIAFPSHEQMIDQYFRSGL